MLDGLRLSSSPVSTANWLRNCLRQPLRIYRLCGRQPSFRYLLLDNVVTTFGASFTMVALPFLLMRLSGKALDLGLASATEALPVLLLVRVYPYLLARYDALFLLRICRLLFVLINAAIALLIWAGQISSMVIYCTSFIGGVVWALAFPAGRIVFAQYLRRAMLPAANAVFAVASSIAALFLPMCAGALILTDSDLQGLALAFWLDACSVLLSIYLLARLARLRKRGQTMLNPDKPTHAAHKSEASRPPFLVLAAILVAGIVVFGPAATFLPVLLVTQANQSTFLLYGAQLLGVLLSANLAAQAVSNLRQLLHRLLLCWVVAAICYLALSSSQHLLVLMGVFTLLAGAANFHALQSMLWLQTRYVGAQMARYISTACTFTLLATPSAALLSGMLIDTLQIPSAARWLAMAVAIMLLLALGMVWRARFR